MPIWKQYKVVATDTYTEVTDYTQYGPSSNGNLKTFEIAYENEFGTDLYFYVAKSYTFDQSTGQFKFSSYEETTYISAQFSDDTNFVDDDTLYVMEARYSGTAATATAIYRAYAGSYYKSIGFHYMHTANKTTTYTRGEYIKDIQATDASAYPEDGKHTDGYWYVKQTYDIGGGGSTGGNAKGKLYVDINGAYKKIAKLYADIGDGVNKKIKKLYADIGGYYRQIFGKGTLTYRGSGIVRLNAYRSNLTGAANKNYAFFFGGTSAWNNSSASTSSVDAISKDLVRHTAPKLSYAQYGVQCGSIGDYAITAENYGESFYSYNGDLTKTLLRNTWSDDLMQAQGEGVNTKDYLVFPAAYNPEQSGFGSDWLHNQLITLDADLTIRRVETAGVELQGDSVSFGGNAVFQADGYNSVATNTLYLLDNDFTVTLLSAKLRTVSGSTRTAAKATVGRHCIFAGGMIEDYYEDDEGGTEYYNAYTTMVDILDDDFTLTTGEKLIYKYDDNTPLAASMEDFAIIAFGYRNGAIRAYDGDLTIVMQAVSDYGRGYTVPVVIGDHALFAGGYITYQHQASDDEANSVEVFTIE